MLTPGLAEQLGFTHILVPKSPAYSARGHWSLEDACRDADNFYGTSGWTVYTLEGWRQLWADQYKPQEELCKPSSIED